MKWELLVGNGKHEGKHIPLSQARFQIGREDNCQLRTSSEVVSRRHCTLTRLGKHLFVSDCHATNGTFVNDRRILPELPVELFHGDRLTIGPMVLIISAIEEPRDNTFEEMAATLLLAMDREEDEQSQPDPTMSETNSMQVCFAQRGKTTPSPNSSEAAGQLLRAVMPPDHH